jgi:aminoglycoside phosphotransferase (APT) family kinase protein
MSDQPIEIRPGETLPLESLQSYLVSNVPGLKHIQEIRQFPGGYSNLTYLLMTNIGELVLRRPPIGADIKSAHDMAREFKVLSLLHNVPFNAPAPIFYCGDSEVIGAPFYLMERIHGIILRNRPPKGLQLPPERMRQISEAAVDKLAGLHTMDIHSTGLIQLGKPEGYTARQTNGWIQRYRNAQTDHVDALDATATWLETHIPAEPAPSFIHNDFKYDNLILDPSNPSKILAVLDWEMATVGNPMMDLGTTLAYWTEAPEAEALPLAAANLSWLPGNLDRAEVLERYIAKTEASSTNYIFYFAFGAFKVATIVQQIYARYRKGISKDPRFANLDKAVQHFGNLAEHAIDKQRIGNLI